MKQLIGIVTGLFCTLVVAEICAFCFKMDFMWYSTLVKPAFMPANIIFSLGLVGVYISNVFTIARMVVLKDFHPTILFFALFGLSTILFVFTFFNLHSIFFGFIFISCGLLACLLVWVRFIFKDTKTALIFLPTLIFVSFCSIVMACLLALN